MIQVNVIGNLGADAQVKELGGKQYITFRMASTTKRNDRDETTWISVMYRYSENLLPYMTKGTQVFVSGEGRVGTYTNRDGITLVDVSIWANIVQLVGKKDEIPF